MATLVLKDAVVLWDGYDLSGNHNKLALNYSAELHDNTVFGATTRSRKGGLKVASLEGGGFWDSGTGEPDDILQPRVGGLTVATAIMISPDGGDGGEVSYAFQPVAGRYEIGAAVGEMLPFTVEAQNRGVGLIRGTVMQNGLIAATGAVTSRELGAVTAAQKLYAGLHVISEQGTSPTIDVVVRSDDNSGMTSATSRITFAQVTAAPDVQWATPVSGAISDTWWDLNITIGGSDTPGFTIVVWVAIQ